MKWAEPTSSNESGSIQNLVSYSFIGVVFIIVLFLILSVVREEERGIEVERPLFADVYGGSPLRLAINEYGDVLIDGKFVDNTEIVTIVTLSLGKLSEHDTLDIIIQPHDKSLMEASARIYDLIMGIDDPRIAVKFQ